MFRLPPPYLWTPLSPQRVKGCSPLTIPKMRSKPKNASRFAKRIFLCFSHLRLRRKFHLSAGLYALRGRNTRCEAASRRNEKKVQQRRPPPAADTGRSCWGSGQQDASDSEADAGSRNPSDPARRNRWCFSGSLLARKRELSLTATAFYPAPQARNLVSLFRALRFASDVTLSIYLPPAQYSAAPHPRATRPGCVPPAPGSSGGCGPASHGLPASGR